MSNQKVLITLDDLDNNRIDVRTQFMPEVNGASNSPSVGLWKLLMDAIKSESEPPHWMTTFTGKRFFPLAPHPDDICIEDIAHHLAFSNRFGGATRQSYSIAQHSIHVSRLVPPELALLGLMHDAPEAYIGDMVHPLKVAMSRFKSVEFRLWEVIAKKFDLPITDPSSNPALKQADIKACMTERRDLLNSSGHKWVAEYEAVEPDEEYIFPLSAQMAESAFLSRFNVLSIK